LIGSENNELKRGRKEKGRSRVKSDFEKTSANLSKPEPRERAEYVRPEKKGKVKLACRPSDCLYSAGRGAGGVQKRMNAIYGGHQSWWTKVFWCVGAEVRGNNK